MSSRHIGITELYKKHAMYKQSNWAPDESDTSNVKMKFTTSSFASGTLLLGNTGYNRTSFTFIRLGDSQ